MELEDKLTPKEAPRGIHNGHVDDKGRLKLPVSIERFLKGQKLFITSLEGRIGRIYPLPVWQENEKLLFQDLDDPEGAEDLSFTADKYGDYAEVDGQARVLLPASLRRKLGIEGATVQLREFKGVIHILSGEVFEQKDRRAEDGLDEKVKKFGKKGIK